MVLTAGTERAAAILGCAELQELCVFYRIWETRLVRRCPDEEWIRGLEEIAGEVTGVKRVEEMNRGWVERGWEKLVEMVKGKEVCKERRRLKVEGGLWRVDNELLWLKRYSREFGAYMENAENGGFGQWRARCAECEKMLSGGMWMVRGRPSV